METRRPSRGAARVEDMLTEFLVRIDGLLTAFRRARPVNINDQESKNRTLALATSYFNDVRPHLVERIGEVEAVVHHDGEWQQLVRLAQGNNARRSYLAILARLRRQLAEFNVRALTSVAGRSVLPSGAEHPREERLLLETLDGLIPSAATSYRQGVLDLRSSDRLSYRGTAAEFRESLREVLDHLAPDDDVEKQPGFKLERDQTKPTMKQKVRFVLSSRGLKRTQQEPSEKSASLVEEMSGEVARAVYNRASLATHVQESKREVEQIKRYVDTVLFDLLEIRDGSSVSRPTRR